MFKRTAAFILAVCSISLSLTACKRSDTAGEIKLPIYGAEEISYEVATAKYMDISETDSMGVTIDYPFADNLYYPAEAQLVSFSAVRGKAIAQGEVIAELDSSALDYDINNQQTIVDTAYAASLSGGEAARLNYEIEKYTLDMMLKEKESYTIRAPYDGVVTTINRVSVGSTVEAGSVCCAIAPELDVQIYVDGGDASKFRFGQEVTVRIDGDDYKAIVAQAPDVIPETASNGGARRAIFKLEDGVIEKIMEENPLAITAGWATVYLTSQRKNVLAVPDSAVKSSGTYSYVTLVDGEERFKLAVTTGESLGGFTEIIDGIAEGDLVMAEGSGIFTEPDTEKEDNGGWNGEWNGDFDGEWNGSRPERE